MKKILKPTPLKTPIGEKLSSETLTLKPEDNQRLINLCGPYDQNLRTMEQRLGVEINTRGQTFQIIGAQQAVFQAKEVLESLYKQANESISSIVLSTIIQDVENKSFDRIDAMIQNEVPKDLEPISTPTKSIEPRVQQQKLYIHNIRQHIINFGIGPAGTGKTYLAVAMAVEALLNEQVSRICLVRPAVEAGERLGFLPGDLSQKIDPYLRPLYDALYEMLGSEQVNKYIERQVIEIAPLAYMRGRTLNDSFIILDESQNTTIEQMKMFLTRIGFNSKVVVTGDVTQVDLPLNKPSGLRHVIKVLAEVEGISFCFFRARDVVRHPLVQSIVKAYETHHNHPSE